MDDRVKTWLGRLDSEPKAYETWRKDARKLVLRYRGDKGGNSDGGKPKYNIFWANVETLKPVAYGRTPEPNIERRYLDGDPIAFQACDLTQRALSWNIDDYKFHTEMEKVRDDVLIVGRGVARIKYDAEIDTLYPEPFYGEDFEQEGGDSGESGESGTGPEPLGYTLNGDVVDPDFDDDGKPYLERKGKESVYSCYVFWEDFRHDPVRSWEDVRWVAFRHLMTRGDLKKQFGRKKGGAVPLNYSSEGDKKDREQEGDFACVWEIWDKPSRKRLFVADGHDKVLLEEEDPLKLEGFFPCPKPAQIISTNETLVPVPEFNIYANQADELDEVCERISKLTAAAQAKGLYSGAMKEIIDLVNECDDGQLKPVGDPALWSASGGLRGNIWYMPLKEIIDVVIALSQREGQLKSQIYEISGISDIMRGTTKASETLGAQQLKGQYSASRTGPRSEPMRVMVRDLYRMMAEVMCRFFSAETWQRITGIQPAPEVLQLMKDPKAFEYRIDIETDATVAEDAATKKQDTVEFTTAFVQYLQAASQIVAGAPETARMMGEIGKWIVRRFGKAKQLEKVIDETMDQLMQKSQQPPPPDPKVEALKMKAQIDQQKAQADMQAKQMDAQLKQQQAQAEMQMDGARLQAEIQGDQMRAQTDIQIAREKAAADIQIARQKAAIDARLSAQQAQNDMAIQSQQAAQQAEIARKQAAAKPKAPAR